MVLRECSVNVCGDSGVLVHGEGATAYVEGCTFHKNARCGVLSSNEVVVTVKNCLVVSKIACEHDKVACHVEHGGALVMEEVTVDGVRKSRRLP